MKKNMRLASILLVVAILFSGCSFRGKTVFFASKSGRNEVFKIGDYVCSKEEAYIYLANYKNIYGTVYGTNLWNESYDTDTMETSIKDAVLTHLINVYALNVYATQNEITLTDAEKANVAEAASVYYESLNKQERNYTGVSKSDIEQMYMKYALAEKIYVNLMDSVDGDVSEDDARIMEAMVIFVTDEELAYTIADKLASGASFERLANTYNELDSIDVTFGRGTYDSVIEDVVFQLEDDEISDMITTEDGYYFFYCVNKYNEELSEENKITIVEERQEQAMEGVITSIKDEYYSDFNSELWEQMEVSDSADVTTNSFFTTLDSYISF